MGNDSRTDWWHGFGIGIVLRSIPRIGGDNYGSELAELRRTGVTDESRYSVSTILEGSTAKPRTKLFGLPIPICGSIRRERAIDRH